MPACSACAHPARPAIDETILAGGSSNREIAARYGVGRNVVARHAAFCLGLIDAPKARSSRRNARDRVRRRVDAALREVLPEVRLDTPEDVIAQLKVLFVESRVMLAEARTTGNLMRAEKTLSNCVLILEKIGRAYGVFQADAAVLVDRRTQVANIIVDKMGEEQLRALLRGEPVDLPALGGVVT